MANWWFFASNIGKNVGKKKRKTLKLFVSYRHKLQSTSNATALLMINNHLQTFVHKADGSLISFSCKWEYDASSSDCHLSQNGLDIWLIDHLWGQDGWILAKLRCINAWKTKRGQHPASLRTLTYFRLSVTSNSRKYVCVRRLVSRHLDKTSLVNNAFIIWLSGHFPCGTHAGSPKRER